MGKIRRLMMEHQFSIPQGLVAWYNVKLQGATNERMKKSPTLIDLSGNGRDVTLENFDFDGVTNGIIGDYLMFRNVSENNFPANKTIAYGWCDTFPQLSDFTIVCKRILPLEHIGEYYAKGCHVCSLGGENMYDTGFVFDQMAWTDMQMNSFRKETPFAIKRYAPPELYSWATPTKYNGRTITRGDNAISGTKFRFCRLRDTNVSVGMYNLKLYSIAIFDRSLSESDIQEVKNNML